MHVVYISIDEKSAKRLTNLWVDVSLLPDHRVVLVVGIVGIPK